MTRYFSKADLDRLSQQHADLGDRYSKLQDAILARTFKSARAQEYARQALGRRLDEMSRSIAFVFELLPPEKEDIPERDSRIAATMLLQSFFINVQGCLDNLAWIWVYETGLEDPDGGEMRRGLVGLGRDYRYLMKTFSDGFRTYVRGLKKWMKHISEFRDTVAHRIPLYIPPYIIDDKDVAEYNRLGQEVNAAVSRGDMEAYDTLRKQQDALGKYRPWMNHSPTEGSPVCVFHPQILQDFVTIDEITRKLFTEIDNFKPTPKPASWWSRLKSALARLRPGNW
jgi:hypothetical protein